MNTIGEKIKKIRELKGLTTKFVADKLQITPAGYNKIERGQTDITYSKIEEIAKILGVTTEELLVFDQQRVFNGYNTVKGDNSNNVIVNDIKEIKRLYEDKILLLEKLLKNSEAMVTSYQDKFGDIL
jgi:transcriptional regulator with XRE-family HTH domain